MTNASLTKSEKKIKSIKADDAFIFLKKIKNKKKNFASKLVFLMESLEKPYTTRQRFFYALQPRKTISYRTSRYCQNIPFRRLNRYRNKAESYRPKYRGLPACFGYSGEFRSFSVIFSFRTDTNITGFFFKKLDAYSNLQQLVTIIEASTC